jgi:hypothetical protein
LNPVEVLNTAYKNERIAGARERILLIPRVRMDKREASGVAGKELHWSRISIKNIEEGVDNARISIGMAGLQKCLKSYSADQINVQS